ncbi:hypothetical protein BACCAP_00696 [Pseudoflavonifractor capillosus ATCC 29799]|uniref:Uncharacterized protein n=1 Tax=Pseudoflavonifractor capillosus ATCC 29799 TaxID=411467 RepID=A6NR71_9FIRM|nr:hypothetical protein [Pseudoflavonifractor capillosus]EDN01567.1 hypothetical protein BACCAP_00696 [Pseudoflavonifractor capillosus ATCC 29799]
MKENRQGCLSRAIKPFFQALKKLEKMQQPVENTFSTGCARRAVRGGLHPYILREDGR